jgi:hypothetical protein
MKNIAAVLFLSLGFLLHAQTVNPPVMVDMGVNPLCFAPPLGFVALCEQPINHTYLLIMWAHSPQTTTFRYMVTGTLPDGTVKTLKASVDRSPDSPTTNAMLSFGGQVADIKIQVEEFALVAVTTNAVSGGL